MGGFLDFTEMFAIQLSGMQIVFAGKPQQQQQQQKQLGNKVGDIHSNLSGGEKKKKRKEVGFL